MAAILCFYSTYEELKQMKKILVNAFSIQVFTVPMRNWNFFVSSVINQRFSVFTVPMRNWNYKSLYCVKLEVGVFTVPMRNWNFLKYVFCVLNYIGFYSTYEELKLSIKNVAFDVAFGFYSTYEELKQRCQVPFICQKFGFYSTYEELKLLLPVLI